MLRMVLRRMFNNLWMVICLLLGSIMATALISCIPIYTDGILQRMLTKDLENYQIERSDFPGLYKVKANFFYNFKPEDRYNAFRYFDDKIMNMNLRQINLPVLSSSQSIKLSNLSFLSTYKSGDYRREDYKDEDYKHAKLGTLSGIEDHITITNGRLFSEKPQDGVYEVIVSRKVMKELELLLDKVYVLTDPTNKYSYVCKVKLVGVFEIKDINDAYWVQGLGDFSREFVMNYRLFKKSFTKDSSSLFTEAQWNASYDYHSIKLLNLSDITNTYDNQVKWYSKYKGSINFEMTASSILQNYAKRAAQLSNMLWVLTVPVFIMLAFYLFMVSQLLIGNDVNAIAVLTSRGASRKQIIFSYLLEGLILGAVAFISGPLVGLIICILLGSTNGFLDFVQRAALPLYLNARIFGYSFAAVVFIIITILIPVISLSGSGKTIVKHKQQSARLNKAAIWKKFFLDIILLLVSGYGIYNYKKQLKVLATTGVDALELQIDPLLFLASTLFVLGAGLLFLRIYPYIIRFIYWVGKKYWSPVLYISLIQVGRSKGQEQFLMLFIILAIATGLFNANSARTINKNLEDRISYSIGADVRLMAVWEDNRSDNSEGPMGMGRQETASKEPLRYFEPDYNKFSTLSGTDMATKVLNVNDGKMQTSTEWVNNINVMGIIPDQFARIAWFRSDLLPYHWYNYINLLSDAPKAFLVSSNLKDKYKLAEGDTIYVSWGEQSYLEGRIYAFIDYWPAYNPNMRADGREPPGLVVANMSYIQSKLALQPYEVWIKKKEDATDKQINDDIIKRNLDIAKIDYRDQQLIKMKNDPMMQGMNGMLTLCFIAAMVISMLGFLIYWIISIQNRVLQFGILRAMGLSLSKVIGMLSCEQVLVSGGAILTGIIIGGLAGDIFIPLLQIIYNSADQVPPFKIMSSAADYIKVYAVIGLMLLTGLLTLWRLISKIKIDQAVKLGED